MYLLVDKNTNEVYFVEEKVVEVDNGYLVVVNGQQWQEVPKELFNCIEANVIKPDDFEKGKYTYDKEKGLVVVPNWVNPAYSNRTVLYKEMITEITPRDKRIADLELMIAELML